MPTTLDVFVSSKMVELKAERDTLYALLPSLSYGDIHLRAWVFENDAPATEKSIRDVYLKALRESALYIGLFWKQYGEWTIDEFERAAEWGIERHIYVKDVEAEQRDEKLDKFLKEHGDVRAGITAKWFKIGTEFSESVRQSVAAWLQARQSHSTSPEAQLIRNPHDLRRPKQMFGRNALLRQLDLLVNDSERVLLQGAGGMGKTAVAGEAAARFMAQTNKPVLWLTIGSGEAEVVFEALAQPAKMTKEVASATGEGKAQALKSAIRATGAGLVILDNAWNGAALHTTLNALPAELPVLVTARQRFPLENVLEVGELAPADALGLLTYHSKRETGAAAPELCKKLGYLAFALEVAGKTMKMKGWAAAEMMREIQEAPHKLERPVIYGEQEVISVQDLLTASLYALPDADTRRVFLTFGAFFAPQLTPEMLQLYFASVDEEGRRRASSLQPATLSILEQYGLAERISATDNAVEHYQIHDLAYSYVRARSDDDAHQYALDACLGYTTRYKESELKNFIALRPELDNLLNAADWAAKVARYAAVQQIAHDLYSGANDTGGFLLFQGYTQQAIDLLILAVKTAEKAGNNRVRGNHLGNLGSIYRDIGQVQKAIQCHEEALTIARMVGNERDANVWLGNLGISHYVLGQVERAIEQFEAVLPYAVGAHDQRLKETLYGYLGLAYSVMGRMELAVEHLKQALTVARETGNKRLEGIHLGNMGLINFNLGQLDQAIESFKEALAIARQTGDRRDEGAQLGNLGIVFRHQGNMQAAIDQYKQALTIAREIGDRRAESNHLGNLGVAHAHIGQPERAIEYHKQALIVTQEIGHRRGEGSQWGGLGEAYVALGQLDSAIEHYEQALMIARETQDHRMESNALGSLGNVYLTMHKTARAKQYYQDALSISQAIGDKMGEANNLNNIGMAHDDQNEYSSAVEHYQQAQAIYAEVGAEHMVRQVEENIAIVRRKLEGR